MLRELIVPVGTSMLTNWMPRLDPDVQLPNGWLGAIASLEAESAPPDHRFWLPRFTASLAKDGRTSAELDSTRRWIAKQPQFQLSRITLLVSDTPAATWVAKALESLMAAVVGHGVSVESRSVRRLRAEDMREGLVEFIRVAAHAIKEAHSRGAIPVVNATPGFKAEAALLTLLGALLGAETVYLHEHMQDVIVVPAIPLQWGLQAHEIRTLRQVGEAIPRDGVRELGIGSLPNLWPFVERSGDGDDELWGLSALGQMVIESSSEESVEEPPTWDGAVVFKDSENEQGHQPGDARELAQEIERRLPFVKVVRLYGWQGYGSAGILMPRADDRGAGLIRLRLQSTDKSLRLLFLLYTTVETEGQWRTARLRTAEAFGRVGLVEELAEAFYEGGASSDVNQMPKELTQLRAEQLLQERLNHSESEIVELKKQVTDLDEALNRANVANARLNAKLDAQRKTNQESEDLLKVKDQELLALMEQVESLRRDLERATSEEKHDVPIQ